MAHVADTHECSVVDEFCDDPCLYGNIEFVENDMVQGILANCWFAAAINASAKTDRTIITRAFFPEQRMADGLFGVNIFLEGFARMVKVDNFVPTHDGAPIFPNLKDSNVVWPLIDEKAFAQISGGCHNLRGDHPDCLGFLQVVRLLIGCEPERTVVEAHDIDHVNTELRRCADSKCVVAAHRAYELLDKHGYVVFGLRKVTINKKTR